MSVQYVNELLLIYQVAFMFEIFLMDTKSLMMTYGPTLDLNCKMYMLSLIGGGIFI